MMKDKAFALYEVVQGDTDLLRNKAVGKAYDAGAKAILNELAMGRLFSLGDANKIEHTSETKKQIKVCNDLYNKIMEKVKHDPELVALLWNLDTEYGILEMLSSTDHFVQAFMEGYNFRKTATGERDLANED